MEFALPASLPDTPFEHRLELSEILQELLADGYIDERRKAELLHSYRDSSVYRHPLLTIAEQGWPNPLRPAQQLDAETLTRWLSLKYNIDYLRIDPLKIDVSAVTGVMTYAYASRFQILPVKVAGNRVTVATAQPFIREWETELSKILKLNFERVLVNPASVDRYLGEFYAVSRSIDGANLKEPSGIGTVTNIEQLVELGNTGEVDADDKHIVRIVDWLLQYAFEQRASDIHLEPRRKTGNIRFRIDGVLHQVHQIPSPILNAVIARSKALGRMDVVERRRPQDGRIKTKSPSDREVELRLSTMPTTFGEKMVMRIFDPELLVKGISELGFSTHDLDQWKQMTAQPHGVIVVTGPTGSGKTTTLYSALKTLARPELNVCTIEDPIEMVDPAFNQMHVQTNIGLTFAAGVRTLLRQDPDIIMIGEIRDKETAETAIQAALTGHLVLSTLHTNDAASSVTRFLDLGIAPYLIKATLLGVVAQRLVRTLCPHCKAPVALEKNEWTALTNPIKVRAPREAYGAVGCDECRNTGFSGRIGIYEMMTLTDHIRASINATTDARSLREIAMRHGMRPLRISGAEKVQAGITTPAEVFSVVPVDS